MATDLERAANAVSLPPALADRMRNVARGIDEVHWRLPHRVHKPKGGFVQPSHTHTLESTLVIPRHTDVLGASDSHNATVRIVNTALLRYRQTSPPEHQRLILGAVARYLVLDPDPSAVLYPGTLGDTIFLMLGPNELTGVDRFLRQADPFGRFGLQHFFDDTSPSPCATSHRRDWESKVNRPDRALIALLALGAGDMHAPETRLSILWTDH